MDDAWLDRAATADESLADSLFSRPAASTGYCEYYVYDAAKIRHESRAPGNRHHAHLPSTLAPSLTPRMTGRSSNQQNRHADCCSRSLFRPQSARSVVLGTTWALGQHRLSPRRRAVLIGHTHWIARAPALLMYLYIVRTTVVRSECRGAIPPPRSTILFRLSIPINLSRIRRLRSGLRTSSATCARLPACSRKTSRRLPGQRSSTCSSPCYPVCYPVPVPSSSSFLNMCAIGAKHRLKAALFRSGVAPRPAWTLYLLRSTCLYFHRGRVSFSCMMYFRISEVSSILFWCSVQVRFVSCL